MSDNPMGRVGVTFTAAQEALILGLTVEDYIKLLKQERGEFHANAQLLALEGIFTGAPDFVQELARKLIDEAS